MTRLRIPAPISGGVLLSYKCTARCRHCMYGCSPHWSADWISLADLERGLTQLARFIVPSPWGAETVSLNHGLHFTGGEPFMNFELLLKAVGVAEGLGIPSTFVETNAFWSTGDARTEDRLVRLRDAGLEGILISVNPFYAEYVPFARTERCIRCSRRVFGDNVMVYQAEYYRRFVELGIGHRISVERYREMSGNEPLEKRVELFLMGRATRQLRKLYPSYPAKAFLDEPCRPAFLRSWHNHFDNYGNFVPGYCGGISLGSWFNLDEIASEGVDLEGRPVLKLLVADEFRDLLRLAEAFGYRPSPSGYVSKCDLCVDMRTHLASTQHFPELAPQAFYLHLS